MPTSPAGTYGTDIKYNGEDILPSLEIQNTEVIVLENIVRRLKSNFGSLFYDEEYGYNLFNLIKAPVNLNSSLIELECLKDERVSEAVCFIAYSEEQVQISIRVGLVYAETFNLVFNLKETEIEIAYEKLS